MQSVHDFQALVSQTWAEVTDCELSLSLISAACFELEFSGEPKPQQSKAQLGLGRLQPYLLESKKVNSWEWYHLSQWKPKGYQVNFL